MGCATAGELRAFLDGELVGEEGARVQQHLASCASCQRETESLRENASYAEVALGFMAPSETEVPGYNWSQIRDRVDGRVGNLVTIGWGISQMLRNAFNLASGSRLKIAGSTIAVLVAVSLLFTLSPVQTAASSFLSIFRVQKFAVVTVDPSSLPDLASPADLGSFTFSGDRTAREVPVADAEKAVGFRIPVITNLPVGLEPGPRSTTVVNSFSATYTPDLKKVRAYLASIGASNVKLPDNLDGAPISMQMPASVAQLYAERGGMDRLPDGTVKPLVGQRFLFLGATTSPTMNVPDGIDVEQIRSEMLKVPGLPPDLVNQLKAIDDWRNTVVVPVVKGTSREVTVQGEKGLLITEANGQGSTLLWLKGGVVFTLTGNLPADDILAAANSMR